MDIRHEQLCLAVTVAAAAHIARAVFGDVHVGEIAGAVALGDAGRLGCLVVALPVVLAEPEAVDGLGDTAAGRAAEITGLTGDVGFECAGILQW